MEWMANCPYLGLKDDPKTAIDDPDRRNCCHRAWPVVPVDPAYQHDFCLSAKHRFCPVFMSKEDRPSSLPIIDPKYKRIQIGKGIFGLALLAALVVAGSWLWRSFTGQAAVGPASQSANPASTADTPGVATMQFIGAEPQATPIILNTSTATLPPGATIQVCNTPPNWTPYSIKPTDSLYLLSMVYQVTIAELQEANCLSEDSLLRPGDWIFVPAQIGPTSTVTATITPSATVRAQRTPATGWTQSPDAEPRRSPTPRREEEPTPIPPPTSPPPTTVPPTRTQAPVEPTPTSPPPPTTASEPPTAPPPPPTIEPTTAPVDTETPAAPAPEPAQED